MFTQKKRNSRNWIWVAIACVAVALAVFLLLGYLGRNNDDPYARTNGEDQVYDQAEKDDTVYAEDDASSADEDIEEKESSDGVFQSYYLVKYDKDVIRIYFSDQSGKITELEETTIIYETLSEADQQRFEEGIRLENRNELNKLLMDYES